MNNLQQASTVDWLNKVPVITLSFWLIKILSTTVGETGADFLAFNVGLGAHLTCLIMSSLLLIALVMQLRTGRNVPWIYWLTVVLVSIVGTQLTDLLTDSLGVSLYLSTTAFSLLLALIFLIWYHIEGTLSIQEITTPRRELFYWVAILCTFALGTAAGDLATEAFGLGFILGAGVFGALIGLTFLAWRRGVNPVLTFWVAYILTRPFGAALGDFLTQNPSVGGLGIGPMWTSAIFLFIIVMLVGKAQFNLNTQSNPINQIPR